MKPATTPRLFDALSRRLSTGLLGLGLALTASVAAAAPQAFGPLRVEVVGQGRPVLMIPGLNSAASVWTETCAALQPGVQCHLVQLPGFAGAPALKTEQFLAEMRDQLWAYAEARKLEQPVLMGHSLGGTLALMLAAQHPQAVDRLVIVDALPFIGGLRGPGVTPEQARQMAESMRRQMLALSAEQWSAAAPQSARGMSRHADRTQRLIEWGLSSDRDTTIQAMSELWASDLRPLLPQIQRPVLVLGAWAAYAPMGSTLESTRRIFEQQYAGLKSLNLAMSEGGYHFLMWDDPEWLSSQVKAFLASR